MKQTTVRVPDLMLLVGTRVALGIGVGLLVAGRLDDRARKGAGVALLLVGAITTVPILLNVRASQRAVGTETAAATRGGMGAQTEPRGAGAFQGGPTA